MLARFKTRPQKTSLCPLNITHPLELVHMDYLKIESNQTDKDIHILIVTDHFTQFAQAFVTPNETASCSGLNFVGSIFHEIWDSGER